MVGEERGDGAIRSVVPVGVPLSIYSVILATIPLRTRAHFTAFIPRVHNPQRFGILRIIKSSRSPNCIWLYLPLARTDIDIAKCQVDHGCQKIEYQKARRRRHGYCRFRIRCRSWRRGIENQMARAFFVTDIAGFALFVFARSISRLARWLREPFPSRGKNCTSPGYACTLEKTATQRGESYTRSIPSQRNLICTALHMQCVSTRALLSRRKSAPSRFRSENQ